MESVAVLGLGGGVDYEITVSGGVLAELVDHYEIRRAELTSSAPVITERDLIVSILGYVARGGGGEHFVASPDVLESFAQRFPRRTTLGGTSVRAGITMSRLGVPSTLHLVSFNDHFRRLLPADCDYICSGTVDTTYPHLIVQYGADLQVCVGETDLRAPSGNRLIYVNDPANAELRLSDQLGDLLGRARLFLISGLNAIRDPDVLAARLETLRQQLPRLPADAIVYYEDAAFHEPRFSRQVRTELAHRIDVYGLNEDELQTHLGHPVNLLSVAEVSHALIELRAQVAVPTLILHTSGWALAHGSRAGDYAAALDQGILAASARYAYGDAYTEDQLARLRRRPRRAEAAKFAAELESRMGGSVYCRAGFDLDVAKPTTVGLGDTFVGGFLAAVG